MDITVQPPIRRSIAHCYTMGLYIPVALINGYSGTSDKGPFEIGTTSLQRTLVSNTLVYYFTSRPLYKEYLFQPHANTYYLTSEIGAASLQGTKSLAP